MLGIFEAEWRKKCANLVKSPRDEVHYTTGRRFAQLEEGNPTAPLKASQQRKAPRQHRNLLCQQVLE